MYRKKNRTYECKICNKPYASSGSLWFHNNKFHNNIVDNNKLSAQNIISQEKNVISQKKDVILQAQNFISQAQNIISQEKNVISQAQTVISQAQNIISQAQTKHFCKFCNKNFARNYCVIRHEKICKTKINEITIIKEENNKLKEQLKNNSKIESKINKESLNNHLIDIISDKNKKIEELINNQSKVEIQQIIPNDIIPVESLTLNNIVITYRNEDKYINANQLCQAGSKKFDNWYELSSTKHLITEIASDEGISTSQLIDNNNNESWIHPDLAIQLSQWISPKFAIQVSKWIGQLCINRKVEINLELVSDNKLKDQKIKLLEDTFVKKHRRNNYPDKNVIYILTTEFHLKNRMYIIGKTKHLKNRLSTYNKTCDHQVVYYKECANEEIMNLVELLVLNKLKQYQEKANRDRFILPIENDISLFINIIENCIKFL